MLFMEEEGLCAGWPLFWSAKWSLYVALEATLLSCPRHEPQRPNLQVPIEMFVPCCLLLYCQIEATFLCLNMMWRMALASEFLLAGRLKPHVLDWIWREEWHYLVDWYMIQRRTGFWGSTICLFRDDSNMYGIPDWRFAWSFCSLHYWNTSEFEHNMSCAIIVECWSGACEMWMQWRI